MENVEKWCWLGINQEKLTIEEEAKSYVASKCEEYINGVNDDGIKAYPPMTVEEWVSYVRAIRDEDIKDGMMVNNREYKHLKFFGNDRFDELTRRYVQNYSEIKEMGLLK